MTLSKEFIDPKGGRIVNRRKVDGVRKDNDKSIPLKPYIEIRNDSKTNCLSTVQKDNIIIEGLTWRKLSPIECEKLQTIKPNYTEYGVFRNDKNYDPTLHEHLQLKKISNSQRYKMLGNGFSVDTIAWILQGMDR